MKRYCILPILLVSLLACSPAKVKRLWQVEVGDYSQTPAVAPDGTLITYDYANADGSTRFIGLDPNDGTQIWDYDHEWGDTRAASLDADGMLIVNGMDRVIGLDPADGSEVWSVDEPGVGYLQAVDDDRIYLVRQNQGASTNFKLVAIKGEKVLWEQPLDELIAGIAVGKDGTLFAAGTSLTAYDPDGTVKWSEELPGPASYLALAPGQAIMQLMPNAEFVGGVSAFDRENGKLLWTSEAQSDYEPAIASDGTLYVSSMFGLQALDGDSGDVLWDAEINLQAVALGRDGRLYGMAMLPEDEDLPDLGTFLHFVVLSSSDGEILYQEFQNESADSLNYAPSFDGKRVYFGAGYFLANVYAFKGGPGLAKGPWPRTGGDNGYRYKEQ